MRLRTTSSHDSSPLQKRSWQNIASQSMKRGKFSTTYHIDHQRKPSPGYWEEAKGMSEDETNYRKRSPSHNIPTLSPPSSKKSLEKVYIKKDKEDNQSGKVVASGKVRGRPGKMVIDGSQKVLPRGRPRKESPLASCKSRSKGKSNKGAPGRPVKAEDSENEEEENLRTSKRLAKKSRQRYSKEGLIPLAKADIKKRKKADDSPAKNQQKMKKKAKSEQQKKKLPRERSARSFIKKEQQYESDEDDSLVATKKRHSAPNSKLKRSTRLAHKRVKKSDRLAKKERRRYSENGYIEDNEKSLPYFHYKARQQHQLAESEDRSQEKKKRRKEEKGGKDDARGRKLKNKKEKQVVQKERDSVDLLEEKAKKHLSTLRHNLFKLRSLTERWRGTDSVEVDERHVPLKHQTHEAKIKVAEAKKGLREVIRDLKKLHEEKGLEDSDWEEEDAFCVVCGGGDATDENDIAVCDKCFCPYHQLCHSPHLTAEDLGEEEDEWWCRRCDFLYDSLSNAILDDFGEDREEKRTFKKVEKLVSPDEEDAAEEEEYDSEEDQDYIPEEDEEEDDDDYGSLHTSSGSSSEEEEEEDDDDDEEDDDDEASSSGEESGGSSKGSAFEALSAYHSSEDSDFSSTEASSDSFDSDFY